jgi:gliding motility-associated-like protein
MRQFCLSKPLHIIVAGILVLTSSTVSAQYTKLHDFGTSFEGVSPYASLVTDGTFLYGVTSDGGTYESGTIYKMDVNGNMTILHTFDEDTGDGTTGGLLVDGTTLYGMTLAGSASSQGNIYKIKTDGTGFTNIFDFNYSANGAFPYGSLITDGTVLYGMTGSGGSKGAGTVFKVNKDGTGFTTLYEFDGNANGGYPTGSLISDGTFLYGMTSGGGNSSRGVIFKIQTDGTNFSRILAFSGVDGTDPRGSLFYDGTFLWGVTRDGGSSGQGVLFRIMTDGSNYSKFSDFNFASDGFNPRGSLISDGTFLYGTTLMGSPGFGGTVFKIKLDGTGYTNIANLGEGSFGTRPEGTLALIGSTLFGARGVGGTAGHGQVYQVDTNGSNNKITYSFQVEGNQPMGALAFDGTYFYATNQRGGLYGVGTLYRIKPDGTAFQRLIDFDGAAHGSTPVSGVFVNSGKVYGMTTIGGATNNGVLFRCNTDGSAFTKLIDFDDANNGDGPRGSLISDGTYLYGMTQLGGSSAHGTIFKIKPDGSGYSKLLDFDGSHGSYPDGDLLLEGGFLFGTTFSGGGNDEGTVFKIDTNGGSYQVLYDFNQSDGGYPEGSLYSDGTYLYGMTSQGGDNNDGVIFRIKKDASGFEVVFNFDSSTGGDPAGALISDGTYLYGTTQYGGLPGQGTIFKIKPDGSGYETMTEFNDGSDPLGTLYSDGTSLYGSTYNGGKNHLGILFKRSLAPAASITSFSPAAGASGTYIRITGIDFDAVSFSNNVVKFNGVTAKVVDGDVNNLVAIVPVGATSGPMSVTAGGVTYTTVDNFTVTPDARMADAKIQTCNATFTGVDGDDNLLMTFEPGLAGAKISVTFSSANIDDEVYIFDGPDDSNKPADSLSNSFPEDGNGFTYTSTSPNGELTFFYQWEDSGSNWHAHISCLLPGVNITIDTQPVDTEGCDNSTSLLTTSASGAGNITYQWQYSQDEFDWVDLADAGGYNGATKASLTVDTSIDSLAGYYRCLVRGDGAPDVTTDEAFLDINGAPGAPSASDPAAACNSASATLTASGGTNGDYRWYTVATGGTAISGQVNSNFTTPTITSTTTYYVAVTNGICESNRSAIVATVNVCTPPVLNTVDSNGAIKGTVTINLTTLLSDAQNDIDLTTLKIVEQPTSGATATLSGTTLTIDYSSTTFSGTDDVAIEVCDNTGLCTTQHFKIVVFGDLVVYNAVSPNNDGKNEFLLLEFIDVIPGKKDNVVRIFNRWGEEVFSVTNYNNNDRVFNGTNKSGHKLPSGTYFYKISFPGGDNARSGYLELKY